MTKKFIFAVLVFFSVFSLFALRVEKQEQNSYDSSVMLNRWYNEQELTGSLEDYWESVDISLATLTKGPDLYSWFGHTAIYVEFPDGYDYMFDYGRFTFEEGFYKNFILGRLWYWCGASMSDYLIGKCQQENRSLTIVRLENLTPSQKRAIVSFLEVNIAQENCTYAYKPLTDNCSTRVRDILNTVTDGDFERWAKTKPGDSYRDNISKIFCNSPLLQWLIDSAQGRFSDSNTTLWDEMFLPENLEKAVIEYSELGSSKTYLVDSRSTDKSKPNSDEPTYRYGLFFIAGLILAAVSAVLYKHGKIWAAYTFTVNLILGILGLVFFFVMFFTLHFEMWNNENLIFINPLLFIPAVLAFKRDKHLKALAVSYFAFAEAALLLVVAKILFSGFFIQNNIGQIVTVLPYYIVNWYLVLKSEKSRLNCE